MAFPSRNPNAPRFDPAQTYESDPNAFHSTAYPSTSSASGYLPNPTARYGVPPGASRLGPGGGGAGGQAYSRDPAASNGGGSGSGNGNVLRRTTVRGAQRGTVRDANANAYSTSRSGTHQQPGEGMPPQRALTRGKTLTRPDRFVAPAPLIAPPGLGPAGNQGGNRLVQTKLVNGVPTLVTREPWWQPWSLFVEVVTFWAPRPLLRRFGGMTDPIKQRAWKEKVALCEIAAVLMGIIGFITMGLNRTLCPQSGHNSANYFQRLGSEP
ncbi:hypothetical protein JCM3774_005510, partial [Rhodotorula dairenensis]